MNTGDSIDHEVSGAGIDDHFRSVDSAPVRYSARRTARVGLGFMATFAGLTVATALTLRYLAAGDSGVAFDVIFYNAAGRIPTVPIRIFFILFFATYAAFCNGGVWTKVRVGLRLEAMFLIACLLIDLAFLFMAASWNIVVPIYHQQLCAGLMALAVFPSTVLREATLPPPAQLRDMPLQPLRNHAVFAGAALVSAIVALIAVVNLVEEISTLRSVALLGGIGPGVVLMQQVFALTLAAVGRWRNARGARQAFAPPLAVLIPAYNEAHGIGYSIYSIDDAARDYPGRIRLYIVDNASRDDTVAAAKAAIANARHITGEVVSCPTPGKAYALNEGLRRIREEFVLRLDADTTLGTGALERAMRHFADPRVAVVGGLPLPKKGRGLITRARMIEVLHRHGFAQVALGAFDGAIGVPGMMAFYRRAVIERVGGIVQNMNGEDTDIALRMAMAGYRIVADPKAVCYTEVPSSFTHLREQRLRWFRSIYHVAARNRGAVLRMRALRADVVVPFALMNAARRAMLVPLVFYAATILALVPDVYVLLQAQAVLALFLGAPMLMAALVVVLMRRPGCLLDMPFYLGFRMVRAYFTLESALTLIYPDVTPVYRRNRGSMVGQLALRGGGQMMPGPGDRLPVPVSSP